MCSIIYEKFIYEFFEIFECLPLTLPNHVSPLYKVFDILKQKKRELLYPYKLN